MYITMAVSAVINTWNEEKNIKRCIDSLASWIDEIIVVDMNSTDATCEIAQKLGARVYSHPQTGYVEPARNFAIEKANSEWIFIIDADEEVHEPLAEKIRTLILGTHGKSFFRIPRKNIIFGKWIKHARWWPDLQIRLFKKGMVTWLNEIHSIPVTQGEGVDLEIKEDNSIIHYNYSSISQFITRMDRYTSIQVKEKLSEGYQLKISDFFKKPFSEFISRYLAEEGYKDGLHGLAVCVLQAISEFVVCLKMWEKQKFEEKELNLQTFEENINTVSSEIQYWIKEEKIKHESGIKKIVKRVIS
ncbi:MAG: glycosyltransferase family 2 protein [Bacteroidetes bacterium]|nr:glycosyltransferase family 2 protein [Bacteroidota bacterium]